MIAPQLELGFDEQVVWSGHPAPWRYAMEALPRFELGGLFFLGGIFFCASFFGIESAAEEVWFCLAPLLASVGGLAMMSVVPLRYRRAKGLVYYITNHRAIIYDKIGTSVENAFAFDAFPAPGIIDYADGSCDVVFYTDVPTRYEETDLEHSASLVRHGLVAIQNGEEIAEWLPDHIEVCRTKP